MKLKRLLFLFLLLCQGGAAQALCLPVLCTCSVQTSNVAFGNYNPLAFGNTDSTGSIQIGCGGVAGLLIPYSVGLSAGGSGSFTNRRMVNGAHTLSYNLYADAAFTSIWGDGSASSLLKSASITLSVLGLAPADQHWVYARLPGRQLTAAPGVYSDTINVTLTYY